MALKARGYCIARGLPFPQPSTSRAVSRLLEMGKIKKIPVKMQGHRFFLIVQIGYSDEEIDCVKMGLWNYF
jgi:hypothetical protein